MSSMSAQADRAKATEAPSKAGCDMIFNALDRLRAEGWTVTLNRVDINKLRVSKHGAAYVVSVTECTS